MACIGYDNCKGEILQGSDTWGLSKGVCSDCFRRAIAAAQDGGAEGVVPEDLLEDYGRIYLLLDKDRDNVRSCLRTLASELGSLLGRDHYKPSTSGTGHLKLSAALERYETYCWFPPCHDTFIEQLPSERFLSYLKQGLMAKDPGAGPKHGDFTHRIHWHVVSRVITNGFTTPKIAGWNHTPLKLFTYLGEAPAIAAKVWTNLFEVGGESYRFPDTLNEHICNGDDYGVLSVNMSRRLNKRMLALESQLDHSIYDAPGANLTFSERDGVTKSKRSWEYVDSLGRANAQYAQKVRKKYGQEGSVDPVLNRGGQQAEVGIQGRINSSYAQFNKDSLAEGGPLVYQKKLGVARLQLLSMQKQALPPRHLTN